MYTLLIVVTCAVALYALTKTWRGTIEFLPSIGWGLLMAFPFIIEYPLFNADTRDTQVVCIIFMAAILFGADLLAARIVPQMAPVQENPKHAMILAGVFAGIYILLTSIHILSVGEIPIIAMLQGRIDEAVHARNAFSRDLAGSLAALKYLYSFSTIVFAVPATLILIAYKRYWLAGGLFLWASAYAVASTAKAPLAIAMIIMASGLVVISPAHISKRILRGFMVAGLGGVALLVILDMNSPYRSLLSDLPNKYASARPSTPTDIVPDFGDYMRAKDTNDIPFIWRKIDYVLYRVFFTPIEVSDRWYEYFHFYPVEGASLMRKIVDGRSHAVMHPANAVGLWAYHERYPEHYTPEVYAYASLDADAHARFGMTGVIAAGTLLAALRLFMAFFNDRGDITRGAFYAAGPILIGYLPSSASIQAILIAQGMVITAGMLFLLFMTKKRRGA